MFPWVLRRLLKTTSGRKVENNTYFQYWTENQLSSVILKSRIAWGSAGLWWVFRQLLNWPEFGVNARLLTIGFIKKMNLTSQVTTLKNKHVWSRTHLKAKADGRDNAEHRSPRAYSTERRQENFRVTLKRAFSTRPNLTWGNFSLLQFLSITPTHYNVWAEGSDSTPRQSKCSSKWKYL